jgi:hypothetical protein
MRKLVFPSLTLLGALGFATPVLAADYVVHPEGSGDSCTRAAPCALATGVARAIAGDTVILMDGVYRQGLSPQNSGSPEAWITFRADDCALPIIEGQGESAPADANGHYPSGVFMSQATYLRFVGIVSRHWDSGFANGWTGEISDSSNGHIEYINCIGDGNGRTGFAMYSARGFTVRECISAHNGGSPTHSWSSGIQLYAVQGAPEENVIERTVSFENVDGQKNNDGSGFIVDEETQGASFLNNLAFGNGGSCMRLTRSHNTRMANFSCYHNGMNPDANSPTNPGEFYWTDQESRDTTTLVNSIAAASGSPQDPEALRFPPASGLSNNLTIDSGLTPFFADPDGINPDFRPPLTAAALVENLGTASGAPDVDIGFDPKCVVQRDPAVPFQKSWWKYAVDYDYIRSIGGVAKCFHPKPRTGGPDLGAYELSGPAHTFTTPGSCVPSTDPGGGASAGGASAGGASAGGASAGGASAGGASAGGASGAQGGLGAGAPGATGSGASGVGGAGPRSGASHEGSCQLARGRSNRAGSGGELLALAAVAGLASRRRRRARLEPAPYEA